MAELRKHGAATTILFPLIDFGATDFESTPVSFVAADTQISKDEGAFANTGSTPVHEGNGIYSLALTATEMQAARIAITVIDAATKAWEDQAFLIETYGDPSAQHALDLDKADPAKDALIAGTVSDTTPAAGNFDGDNGLSATDDFYNGSVLVFTSGSLQGVARKIEDYTGSSKNLVFTANPFPAAPANGDAFLIVGRID